MRSVILLGFVIAGSSLGMGCLCFTSMGEPEFTDAIYTLQVRDAKSNGSIREATVIATWPQGGGSKTVMTDHHGMAEIRWSWRSDMRIGRKGHFPALVVPKDRFPVAVKVAKEGWTAVEFELHAERFVRREDEYRLLEALALDRLWE